MTEELRKNRDYVAIDHSLECDWTFYVPVTATKVSEVADQLNSLTIQVFDIVSPFFTPEKVEYASGKLPQDAPIEHLFSPDQEYEPTVSRGEITLEGELTAKSLAAEVKRSLGYDSDLWFLSLLNVTRGKTAIELETGSESVDRSSPNVRTWRNGLVETTPSLDPLSLDVRLSHPRKDSDPGSLYYKISVFTPTDIWFEDSRIGRNNRERLSRVLIGIKEGVNVVDVVARSNRFIEEKLWRFLQEDAGIED